MSSQPGHRAALLAALDREMRWMNAHSVLFSQVVADLAGLAPTDLEALDILNLTGPIPAGRLAELIGLTTGSTTTLIDRLEAAGCVLRERDPTDRRRVIVRPLGLPDRMTRTVGPAFVSMARGMDELYARYHDEELKLILDFAGKTNAVVAGRVAEVRERAAAARKPDRPGRDDAAAVNGGDR